MRLASDISEEVRLYDRVEPCVEIVCELKGECLRDAVQCSLPVVTTAHDDRGRTVEFPPVSRETVRIWREHMFFPIREFPMDRLWIPILLDEPRRDARSLSVEGELPVLMAASPKLVTGPLPEEEQELTWPHLKKAEVQCTVSHGPGTHVVLDWTGNFELVRDVQIRTADNVVHKWHGRSGSDPQRVVYTFFVHPEGLKVNLEGAVIEATVGTKFKSTTVPFKLKDVPIPH